jgi:hypothetical protein
VVPKLPLDGNNRVEPEALNKLKMDEWRIFCAKNSIEREKIERAPQDMGTRHRCAKPILAIEEHGRRSIGQAELGDPACRKWLPDHLGRHQLSVRGIRSKSRR